MKKFTADFETATWLEDETYVWAWAVCKIDDKYKIRYGNNIDSFMQTARCEKNAIWYFHNLKFDGSFIIDWLLNNDYKWVKNKDEVESKTFTTLISDMGQFYSIEVYFEKTEEKTEKAIFYDSLKIIPFSVSQTAKAFNLEEQKLKIDYNKKRERNHKLTTEEEQYIRNDVLIMSKALKIIFDEGLTKMTRAR